MPATVFTARAAFQMMQSGKNAQAIFHVEICSLLQFSFRPVFGFVFSMFLFAIHQSNQNSPGIIPALNESSKVPSGL